MPVLVSPANVTLGAPAVPAVLVIVKPVASFKVVIDASGIVGVPVIESP
jgi:hypothetical protein